MLAEAKAKNIIEGLLAHGNRGKSAINTVANDLQSYRQTGRMADPPIVPQRSFSSDYPTGTGQPPGSRIALDIDGAALSPTSAIAGRATVGGADKGLSRAGLESAIAALGARIGPGATSTLGKNLGQYTTDRGPDCDEPRATGGPGVGWLPKNETRYRWLHGGYMRNKSRKLKSPALLIK